jgi:hypothetical protein
VSVTELFGRELWQKVGQDLKGESLRWWTEYQEDLVELGSTEVREMLLALQDGGTVEAKAKIALHWAKHDRASWTHYRDGTTKQLEGIAIRRARLLEALENLGERAAQVLGKIARGVLMP